MICEKALHLILLQNIKKVVSFIIVFYLYHIHGSRQFCQIYLLRLTRGYC